jgi:DNA-binding SARP family transcriptional activator
MHGLYWHHILIERGGSMVAFRLALLGVPTAEYNGTPITFERRKALALLAYLAVADQPCSRASLAQLLWPEDDDQRARAGLRRVLAALNETPIAHWIEADRNTISLVKNDGLWVDVHFFGTALDTDPDPNTLAQAVELYNDHFMTGFSLRNSAEFDDWQALHTQLYQQHLTRTLHQLVNLLLKAGDTERAQTYFQRWLELDPLYEYAQRQSMRLLAATGRRDRACRQFESYADLLAQELGVSPSESTRQLYEAIRSNEPIALVEVEQVKSTLPPLPELVVGREAELQELKTMLTTPGISKVVVQGWPGIGKTTLAALIAHDRDLPERYSGGVLFTALGEQPNMYAQLSAWAHALSLEGVTRVDTAEELGRRLTAALRDRRMLLIIDDVWNVSHAQLMNVAGPECATLYTTRLNNVARALVTQPAHIYKLPILTEQASIDLLSNLAPEAVRQNHDEALELVRDLEGLPLALQVAGRLLSVEMAMGWGITDLLHELRDGVQLLEAQAPADRFDPELQATPSVRVLLQRSTNQLDTDTRRCFVLLGVFAPKPATFDLAAMKAVWDVSDPRPAVRSLVARGLLESTHDGRFQMHALLVMHARSIVSE